MAVGIAVAGIAAAQEPQPQEPVFDVPDPTWSSNGSNQTVALVPTFAKIGIGVNHPVARVQVAGTEVLQAPGSGYVVLGEEDALHMQLDRNEIRVSGPSAETVGALYLQRFGGPISIRSSQDLARRIVFPNEGGVGIGTTDPHRWTLDRGYWLEKWSWPSASMAVSGYVAARKVLVEEGVFVDRIRVGERGGGEGGPAFDELHMDAAAMIAGKLTAQEIYVHIEHWADDVFDPDYELRSLPETKHFIEEHHHLPDVPPESDVRESGVDLAEMNAVLLRKVEELTLHAIEQQERIDALEARFDARD